MPSCLTSAAGRGAQVRVIRSYVHHPLTLFIWGFDYSFTNYKFRTKPLIVVKIDCQRGEIQCLCLTGKVYFETLVGDIIVKSSYRWYGVSCHGISRNGMTCPALFCHVMASCAYARRGTAVAVAVDAASAHSRQGLRCKSHSTHASSA